MSSQPTDPTAADAEAVKREYDDLAAVYAEQRAEADEALGRKAEARKWRSIEAEIEQNDGNKAAGRAGRAQSL